MQSNFKSLKNVTKLHYVNIYIFDVYLSYYTLIVNNKKIINKTFLYRIISF